MIKSKNPYVELHPLTDETPNDPNPAGRTKARDSVKQHGGEGVTDPYGFDAGKKGKRKMKLREKLEEAKAALPKAKSGIRGASTQRMAVSARNPGGQKGLTKGSHSQPQAQAHYNAGGDTSQYTRMPMRAMNNAIRTYIDLRKDKRRRAMFGQDAPGSKSGPNRGASGAKSAPTDKSGIGSRRDVIARWQEIASKTKDPAKKKEAIDAFHHHYSKLNSEEAMLEQFKEAMILAEGRYYREGIPRLMNNLFRAGLDLWKDKQRYKQWHGHSYQKGSGDSSSSSSRSTASTDHSAQNREFASFAKLNPRAKSSGSSDDGHAKLSSLDRSRYEPGGSDFKPSTGAKKKIADKAKGEWAAKKERTQGRVERTYSKKKSSAGSWRSMYGRSAESYYNGSTGLISETLSLIRKAKDNGYDYNVIKEVYNRGIEAWTPEEYMTPQQYAFNRVNSFIANGRARALDKDLIEDDDTK